MEIKTIGIRRQLAEYFSKCLTKSDESVELQHNKVLVFNILGGVVTVEPVNYWISIVNYDDNCLCIGPWPGKTRTDYFRFTVKDFKLFLEGRGVI